MATKNENEKVGLNNKEKPRKGKELTSVIQNREKNREGIGEAGVDAQQEQLNTMPEPDTFPKEKVKKKIRNNDEA
ncbi:hypothetical protein [Sphingobacterium lactis]|uniref:Uncharacterized protein n=1 Tax=Sphingobacterium lactis TaxID=797291 RepID=A0A1H6CJ01_9SPHI|nr:hypothetical protein [Sphingobacterium lactis]SEG72898.1 hypothetical protein SAMN05421877_11616 [Sphingobacterium lactis]HAP95827.1 hypothetical protein [Chryseobacterium sp.]